MPFFTVEICATSQKSEFCSYKQEITCKKSCECHLWRIQGSAQKLISPDILQTLIDTCQHRAEVEQLQLCDFVNVTVRKFANCQIAFIGVKESF